MDDDFHIAAEKSCREWRGPEPGLWLILWVWGTLFTVSVASCLKIFGNGEWGENDYCQREAMTRQAPH
jgi:hypothetical protein